MGVKITARELRRLLPDVDLLTAGLAPAFAPDQLAGTGLPVVVAVKSEPGRYEVRIANWTPASDNLRAKGVKRWWRAKKNDREVLRTWVAGYAKVPRAATRRWLAVVVEKKGQLPDPANLTKSLHDACVQAGLLVDDSAEWLDAVTPVVIRAKADATILILEDL